MSHSNFDLIEKWQNKHIKTKPGPNKVTFFSKKLIYIIVIIIIIIIFIIFYLWNIFFEDKISILDSMKDVGNQIKPKSIIKSDYINFDNDSLSSSSYSHTTLSSIIGSASVSGSSSSTPNITSQTGNYLYDNDFAHELS